MKIRVWAFVLILCGVLIVGAAGGFVASLGFGLAGRLVDNVVSVRQDAQPRMEVRLPGGMQGGWRDGRNNRGNMTPPWQEGPQGALPQDFNAGVSIPGTYGEMTGRTEDQVLAAAKEAGTDTWGLAAKENKLDELKTKLTEKVTASLDRMVADGKISKEQKDAYLEKVNMIFRMVDAYAGQIQQDGSKPAA